MRDVEVQQRLIDLEARVAKLEGREPSSPRRRRTKLEVTDDSAGQVAYQGEVRLHGEVRWSISLAARAVLELPDASGAAVLAALGHPTRTAMVRRLLGGPASAAELQQAAGVSSTGQLYHHLRSLTGSGIVEQDGRGSYRVPATAVVPAMVLLLAAADIAGDLPVA